MEELQIDMAVIAITAVVLGIAFVAAYRLNNAARQKDR